MRVLVTGANGFLGNAIVSQLLDCEHEVIALSREFTRARKPTKQFTIDITDPFSFPRHEELKDIDALIHCAGLAHQFGNVETGLFHKVNVIGTANIAELAAEIKVKHFILTSSVSVYGEGKVGLDNDGFNEEHPTKPIGPYAQSKLDAEKVCIDICAKNDIPLTLLRLATVIGEGDRGNIFRLVKAIAMRRFIWIGRGDNRKTFIYKADVARAFEMVVNHKQRGRLEIYNLADESVKVREVVEAIAKALGRKVPGIRIPPKYLKWILSFASKLGSVKRIDNALNSVNKWTSEDMFSAEKFSKEFGFKVESSTIDGIRKEVEHYLRLT